MNGYVKAKSFHTSSSIDVGNVTGEQQSIGFYGNSSSSTTTTSESWTDVVRKTHKGKRPIIVGKKTDVTSKDKLQGVPKFISLHVYSIAPDTEAVTVNDFLKPKFPEVIVEKLSSRNPSLYSSFRVDISGNNLEAALEANLWPSNACVRRFFHPKPPPRKPD